MAASHSNLSYPLRLNHFLSLIAQERMDLIIQFTGPSTIQEFNKSKNKDALKAVVKTDNITLLQVLILFGCELNTVNPNGIFSTSYQVTYSAALNTALKNSKLLNAKMLLRSGAVLKSDSKAHKKTPRQAKFIEHYSSVTKTREISDRLFVEMPSQDVIDLYEILQFDIRTSREFLLQFKSRMQQQGIAVNENELLSFEARRDLLRQSIKTTGKGSQLREEVKLQTIINAYFQCHPDIIYYDKNELINVALSYQNILAIRFLSRLAEIRNIDLFTVQQINFYRWQNFSSARKRQLLHLSDKDEAVDSELVEIIQLYTEVNIYLQHRNISCHGLSMIVGSMQTGDADSICRYLLVHRDFDFALSLFPRCKDKKQIANFAIEQLILNYQREKVSDLVAKNFIIQFVSQGGLASLDIIELNPGFIRDLFALNCLRRLMPVIVGSSQDKKFESFISRSKDHTNYYLELAEYFLIINNAKLMISYLNHLPEKIKVKVFDPQLQRQVVHEINPRKIIAEKFLLHCIEEGDDNIEITISCIQSFMGYAMPCDKKIFDAAVNFNCNRILGLVNGYYVLSNTNVLVETAKMQNFLIEGVCKACFYRVYPDDREKFFSTLVGYEFFERIRSNVGIARAEALRGKMRKVLQDQKNLVALQGAPGGILVPQYPSKEQQQAPICYTSSSHLYANKYPESENLSSSIGIDNRSEGDPETGQKHFKFAQA